MKIINLIFFSLILFIIFLFSGCNNLTINEVNEISSNVSSELDCNELSILFDKTVSSFDIGSCMESPGLIPDLPVGGTLNNLTFKEDCIYHSNLYYYILEFKGFNVTKDILMIADLRKDPYEVGKFYEFNYGEICNFANTMVNRGLFPRNTLKEKICN